jgi:hypothetical protein
MIYKNVESVFDLYPEAIAHPVNCIGISHDPLSKKIKKIWPDYYREYVRACVRKKFLPYCTYYYTINSLFGTGHIITMTIRKNWQERLQQETMRMTIESLISHCAENKILTIAIPIIDNIPQRWFEAELEKSASKIEKSTLKAVLFFENC